MIFYVSTKFFRIIYFIFFFKRTTSIINPIPGGRGVFYYRILGGIANLSELIFQRQNCAVGMKRRIYNNYHKNF